MIKEYVFEDGKYKVFRNDSTYHITGIFRNGEYWEAAMEDVIGDKLFHSMLNEIDRLKEIEAMYNGLCD